MKGKKTSGRGDFEDTQSIPIDFGTLLSEDVSSSGSFYVNEVQSTSLGKLLQALPIPVLLIDKTHRIIFANQACERISPVHEKILGATLSALSPNPAAAQEIQLVVADVFASRKPRVHQALLGIEGSRIWGRIYFRSLRVAEERLVLLLIEDLSLEKRQLAISQKHRDELVHEITERKRAESALKESETLLRSILSTSPVGIGLADNRIMRWANEAWMEMFGFEDEREFVGQSARIIYPSDAEYERVREALYESLQTGQITSVDATLRRKDGFLFDGHIRMKALGTPGLPRVTVAAISDISERKRAEEALRQSETRFRAIFERAEDYIFLKDRSLKYIDVNPAGQRLLGLQASQIIGSTYDDLFSKDDAAYLRDADTRVLRGETVQEEHTIRINGMPVTLLEIRVPLRDDTGEIVGIFTMAHDITDRKRTEVSPEPIKEYPSKAMQATIKNALLAARRNTTVLLTGESGSGKDYLAQYIHNHSARANGPFFAVNCAAIAPGLAESELFGHERGAFTGAVGRKRGLLELAEGGTLLLNEIGELSLSLQAKLLTFLDTRKFTRVGGEKEITVNARLIAATNRDLAKEVATKRFRQDLFYRINVIAIEVPPLRERPEDIPVLLQEILSRLRGELQIHETPVISSGAVNALKTYGWPGNVRELRNVLERALILSHGKELNLETLGLHDVADSVPQDKKTSFGVSFPSHQSLNEITQELKRFLVNEALRRSGGSRQTAARLLGISRHSLKHYMKTLGYDEE
ncbi:MAG: sigma 54-interacting transcriptional regulator [Desulfomonilaceae bacterium]